LVQVIERTDHGALSHASAMAAIDTLMPGIRTGSFAP
jgi:hypothetical protein